MAEQPMVDPGRIAAEGERRQAPATAPFPPGWRGLRARLWKLLPLGVRSAWSPYDNWLRGYSAGWAAARASDGSDELCVCGHERADHYTYSLNGRSQTRCTECDPHSEIREPGNYVMDAGTYEEAMYHAADHDFAPVLPTSVGGDG